MIHGQVMEVVTNLLSYALGGFCVAVPICYPSDTHDDELDADRGKTSRRRRRSAAGPKGYARVARLREWLRQSAHKRSRYATLAPWRTTPLEACGVRVASRPGYGTSCAF